MTQLRDNALFDVRAFLLGVQESAYFEDVANQTIQAMLECASNALSASPFAQHGEVLRGVLHLRPHGQYRGLVYAMAADDAPPTVADEIVSSATLWRWVCQANSALSIDVTLNQMMRLDHSSNPDVTAWSSTNKTDQVLQADSMQAILSSGATHICILPIYGIHRQIVGMVSLEARCRRAMGKSFIWSSGLDDFLCIGAIASPLLLTRPNRPAPATQHGDKLLPVVGDSMLGPIKLLKLFAKQSETLLLMGQTGVGKSRMARWAHAQSKRSNAPFEVLDLLAVPESMQLAHLMGWRRGAFTGAVTDQEGSIERAEGGTLFIDEIDKLSLETQAGLLRLLEERQFRRLGESQERTADVRFIVGTNIDLAKAVQAQTFREDLYYRINVLPTELPPLNQRQDEIAGWARFMLVRCAGAQSVELAAEVLALLESAHWPGNLRQLDNVIRRCFVIALRDHASTGQSIIVRYQHVLEALSVEQGAAPVKVTPQDTASVDTIVRRAARAVVTQAALNTQKGATFDLDLCDGFKGYVLEEATAQLGSLEAAFALFDRERLVESRNHHRTYKREVKRAQALQQQLMDGSSSDDGDDS